MKGLLLRLSALDPDAATAVRVIAHFEALLGSTLEPESLVRSTAGLAECPAGLELPDGRRIRFRPDGTALPASGAGASGAVSGGADLEPAGRVWLERPGSPGPLDDLVLEWMAIAAGVLSGNSRQRQAPHVADPALVELVLSEREGVEDRARALRLMELSPALPLRVAALAVGDGTDAGVAAVALLGRGSPAGTVRIARVGATGVMLIQRRDGGCSPAHELGDVLREVLRARGATTRLPARGQARQPVQGQARGQARQPVQARGPAGVRVGIGGSADPLAAAASWAQARTALRFAVAESPAEAVVEHDTLGSLALLADIPVERLLAQPDAAALAELAAEEGEGAGIAALAAFCRTGSLRQAAAELHLHHSSVAARLARVEERLGYRLRDPQDRFRAQLALYARRLAASG